MGEIEWRKAIDSSQDPAQLRSIAEELRHVGEPWAGKMRMIALDRARQLDAPNNLGGSAAKAATAANVTKTNWWDRHDLCKPDERPLWSYRIDDLTFFSIDRKLKDWWQSCVLGGRLHPDFEPLFVLWAAERFRREWRGEFNRWQFVAQPLGLPWRSQMDQNRLRTITDKGLRLWGLKAYLAGQGKMRVDMLLRQGGFPAQAVAADSDSKVAKWLKQLVAHAASQLQVDEAALLSLAGETIGDLPKWWQTPVFAGLGVELAVAIAELRRAAENRAPGAPVSAWLDHHRPDWRGELPIPIGQQAAKSLVDSLLTVEASRIRVSVRAERWFLRDNGSWRPTIVLQLDGVLPDRDLLISEGYRRLRLQASGAAARWLPGDLAVAEAVEEDDRTFWEVRTLQSQKAAQFPLEEALLTRLVSGGEPIGTPFPLADPVRSDIIVCAAPGQDPAEDQAMPDELVVVGKGSGGYRAKPLWILVPEAWSVSAGVREPQSLDERAWWRIEGDCRVTSPDGDLFLVRPGQAKDDKDSLEIVADAPRRVRSNDGLPLWLGSPTIFVSTAAKRRSPKVGELWWRHPGVKWQSWPPAGQPPSGRIEFGWRENGLLRASERGILLPARFNVSIDGDMLQLLDAGRAVAVRNAQHLGDNRWRLLAAAMGSGEAEIVLGDISLRARLKTREAIATWDGKALAKDSDLYLAELDRYVARFDGQGGAIKLMAHVEDRQGKLLPGSSALWTAAEDLPLSAISRDIASLLRPEELGSRLVLNFNNGHEERWYVREYRPQLEAVADQLVPRFGVLDEGVVLAGRPLHDPEREEEICSYSLADTINHRPIRLPRLEGSWIVYLKRQGMVLSQPQLVSGSLPAPPTHNELIVAQQIRDMTARRQALGRFLDEAAREESGERVRQLISLATSLGALSPAAFDVFVVMAEQVKKGNPLLAARLAMSASESQLPAVLALADGLPFLWPMVGKAAWDEASKLQFEAMLAALKDYLDEATAVKTVAESISTTKKRLHSQIPALGYALGLNRDDGGIDALANAFITRAHDRILAQHSKFSARSSGILPNWKFGGQFWQALDAPCAVALHACGRHKMTDADIRMARQIASRHPRWFAEGLTAYSRVIG